MVSRAGKESIADNTCIPQSRFLMFFIYKHPLLGRKGTQRYVVRISEGHDILIIWCNALMSGVHDTPHFVFILCTLTCLQLVHVVASNFYNL